MDLGLVWYFGYGSNMSRAIFCGRRGMQPRATRWGWLHGYRLVFDLPVGPGERGVANLEIASDGRVCGVLWQLAAEEALRLDRTEGVHRGFYRRVEVEIAVESGERITAFAYRSDLGVSGRKPSQRYLGLLTEGAREHGLPEEYLRFLATFELAEDERSVAKPG